MAESVKLRWQGNTEPDFSHYNVYYGPKSRSYGSPIPVGNLTSHEVGGLKGGVTYYFALTAVDTSGNESGFSDESAVKAASSSTVPINNPTSSIQLPATGRYGNIQGGDESRINNVKYAFGGMSGDVTLTYRVYDVDNRKEVRIILNGKRIAFAPKTNDLQWGDIQTLTLPDKRVKDAGPNTLIFKVRKKKYWWGVSNVSVR
jgi:hypothetical protein